MSKFRAFFLYKKFFLFLKVVLSFLAKVLDNLTALHCKLN